MSISEQLLRDGSDQIGEASSGPLRVAPWLFGSAIFLGAFLLFLLQPILGKMILPWFGGSAGVWAACLLYFQISLLGGYAYAHCLRRYFSAKRQMQVHILLLGASILLLPILPAPGWRHPGYADPAVRILGLLASTIGLPYLLVSSTSPLLQAWYTAIRPGTSVYRFYALSNLGSMLGLICFPVLVEPHFASRSQGWGWSDAYVIFALLSAAVAWYAWRFRESSEDLDTKISHERIKFAFRRNFGLQTLWIALAACGAALMMATTNYLSQNLAPIPLLWILPLGLYLFSFVLCFDMERVYHRLIWIPAMAIGLSVMAWVMFYNGGTTDLKLSIPAMLAGLFCCCMVCNGELARHKPEPSFLTYFYLAISGGGVLGGFFVAILAPHIFKTYAELPICMVFCAVLTLAIVWKETAARAFVSKIRVRVALSSFAAALAAYMSMQTHKMNSRYHLQVRNFYGVLQVKDFETGGEDGWVRSLFHGTIEHGAQLLDPDRRYDPTMYYVRSSGIGLAMAYLRAHGRVRVGAIGLGAGVLASYCRAGDTFRFYEINPEVVKIANSEFSFLKDCHGQLDVETGDGRLTLESEPPQNFDLLAVDAFSGDAIPVHLLTREAFLEYFRHLKSDGILAVDVSNKYLDLVPVVAAISDSLHKSAIVVSDEPTEGSYPAGSDWVLVTGKPEIFRDPIFIYDVKSVEDARPEPGIRLWTDGYSNLLQILDLNKASDEEGANSESE